MSIAFSSLEDSCRRYLSEVRLLKKNTIEAHLLTFRRFRDFLGTKRVRSAHRISLDLAYEFFEESTWTHDRCAIRKLHGGIKIIFRFLRFAEILADDLSEQMITPRVWALADIPEAFSDKGFTTAAVSANPCISGDYGLNQGFERFVVVPKEADGLMIAPEVNRCLESLHAHLAASPVPVQSAPVQVHEFFQPGPPDSIASILP